MICSYWLIVNWTLSYEDCFGIFRFYCSSFRKNINKSFKQRYLLVLKRLLIGIVTQIALNTFLMTRAHLLLHIWSLFLFANHLFVVFEKLMSLFFVSSVSLTIIIVEVPTRLTSALSSVIVAVLIIGNHRCYSISKLLWLWHICVIVCTRPSITSGSVGSIDFCINIVYNGHDSTLRFWRIHISFGLLKLLLLLLLHQYIVEILSIIGYLSIMWQQLQVGLLSSIFCSLGMIIIATHVLRVQVYLRC